MEDDVKDSSNNSDTWVIISNSWLIKPSCEVKEAWLAKVSFVLCLGDKEIWQRKWYFEIIRLIESNHYNASDSVDSALIMAMQLQEFTRFVSPTKFSQPANLTTYAILSLFNLHVHCVHEKTITPDSVR